jgi:uncharacterized protein GlcG (DUF336 family)
MSVFPFRVRILALSCTLASMLAQPASAQLISEKSLSAAIVLTMAQTAMETCKAKGYGVSVTILSNSGEVLIQLRGDGSALRTMDDSQRKAYTARTFGVPSEMWAGNPSHDPNSLLTQSNSMPLTAIDAGGLPIKADGKLIGAIGVSGSPAGDSDEVCAKAAIDKVAAELK